METPPAPPRILSILHRIEDGILGFLLLVLIALAFFQIAGRLFFSTGIRGIDPILYHLVLWVAMLGAAVATRENEHTNIDIVTRIVSPRTTQAIHAVTNLFSSAVASVLCWEGIRFVRDEADAGTRMLDTFPAWIFQLVIPLAFMIIAMRFFIHFITNLRGAAGGNDA